MKRHKASLGRSDWVCSNSRQRRWLSVLTCPSPHTSLTIAPRSDLPTNAPHPHHILVNIAPATATATAVRLLLRRRPEQHLVRARVPARRIHGHHPADDVQGRRRARHADAPVVSSPGAQGQRREHRAVCPARGVRGGASRARPAHAPYLPPARLQSGYRAEFMPLCTPTRALATPGQFSAGASRTAAALNTEPIYITTQRFGPYRRRSGALDNGGEYIAFYYVGQISHDAVRVLLAIPIVRGHTDVPFRRVIFVFTLRRSLDRARFGRRTRACRTSRHTSARCSTSTRPCS